MESFAPKKKTLNITFYILLKIIFETLSTLSAFASRKLNTILGSLNMKTILF